GGSENLGGGVASALSGIYRAAVTTAAAMRKIPSAAGALVPSRPPGCRQDLGRGVAYKGRSPQPHTEPPCPPSADGGAHAHFRDLPRALSKVRSNGELASAGTATRDVPGYGSSLDHARGQD